MKCRKIKMCRVLQPGYNGLQVGFEFSFAVAHCSRWAWVFLQAASYSPFPSLAYFSIEQLLLTLPLNISRRQKYPHACIMKWNSVIKTHAFCTLLISLRSLCSEWTQMKHRYGMRDCCSWRPWICMSRWMWLDVNLLDMSKANSFTLKTSWKGLLQWIH